MGKVYGKNASGSTQLIIDGDAIDKRLSTLEANWDSISLIESGRTDSIAVPAKSHKDVVVTFDKSFSSIPDVVCCLSASSTASDYGSMSAFVSDVTALSATLRVVNNGSSERGPMIRWIAVGK